MKTLLTAKAIDAGECERDWTEERSFGQLEQKGGWILMEWETRPFKPPIRESRELLIMTVSRARARQAMANLHKGARWV